LWGNGLSRHWAWTTAGSNNAWLALDRNDNGIIDDGRELFGSATAQPPLEKGEIRNGFRALAVFDKRENGGNEDGVIDASDAVFHRLRLWRDENHNGKSEPWELKTLYQLGVSRIELNYLKSSKVDQYGNEFLLKARVLSSAGEHGGRYAYDVFLVGGN
jgi:hypothetical protein